MKNKIFFDTSAIYAYINSADPDHREIKNFINNFKGTLIITNYIFDEIITLVLSRQGKKASVLVGNTLLNSSQIERVWITQSDESSAWNLFTTRIDKSYSFTDCASFVIMKRLNMKECLAFDDHFRQEGFKTSLK